MKVVIIFEVLADEFVNEDVFAAQLWFLGLLTFASGASAITSPGAGWYTKANVHLLIERIEDFSSNLRLDLLQDPLIFERDLQRRLQVLKRRHVSTSASGLMSAKTSERKGSAS